MASSSFTAMMVEAGGSRVLEGGSFELIGLEGGSFELIPELISSFF